MIRNMPLVLALFFSGCLSLLPGERFIPGIFRGTAPGYNGPLTVEVETSADSIINIEITEHHENEWYSIEAMREMGERILEEDSLDVDVISGATISSSAFLNAVEDALRKAHRPAPQKDVTLDDTDM